MRAEVVLGVLSWLFVFGCAREEGLQEDWQTFLSEHQTCAVDEDCAVVFPGCPLGCGDVVQSSALDDAEALAETLLRRYERGGRSCAYDCIQLGDPYCADDGQCALTEPDTGQ